jgi:hypothetical protein
MASQLHRKRFISFVIMVAILGILLFGILQVQQASAQTGAPESPPPGNLDKAAPSTGSQVFLPYLFTDHPWVSPFGVEPSTSLASANTIMARAQELKTGWVRLGSRISWRTLQPNPGEPIHWELLAKFENELRNVRAAGLTPLVIITILPTRRQSTSPVIRIIRNQLRADPPGDVRWCSLRAQCG